MAMDKAVQNKLTKCVSHETATSPNSASAIHESRKSRLSRHLRDGKYILALIN